MRLPEEPEKPFNINIIPTIDVIFAILAFFILSSLNLTRSDGLPVNLPDAITAQPQQNTRITIAIAADGRISLDRVPIAIDGLADSLRPLLAPDEQTTVLINADEQTQHGRVVEVMDRLRQIPGVKIAIAAKPESQSN